jgi:RNA polymerase sigma-70 factor (ECF subfamily)
VNDDAQLIDDALTGNSAAFGRLVTRYQDRLYNTLVHVVGSAEDAYDVAQDAFVQAFLKLDTFHRNSAFYTWLYRIAFNLAVSRRRRHKPTSSIDQVRELSGSEPMSHDDAPGDRLDREERVSQVQSALAGLSEEFRDVLVLREIDGCCYETIADILNLPVGTVRSRLHRARLELREQLREVVQQDVK